MPVAGVNRCVISADVFGVSHRITKHGSWSAWEGVQVKRRAFSPQSGRAAAS